MLNRPGFGGGCFESGGDTQLLQSGIVVGLRLGWRDVSDRLQQAVFRLTCHAVPTTWRAPITPRYRLSNDAAADEIRNNSPGWSVWHPDQAGIGRPAASMRRASAKVQLFTNTAVLMRQTLSPFIATTGFNRYAARCR